MTNELIIRENIPMNRCPECGSHVEAHSFNGLSEIWCYNRSSCGFVMGRSYDEETTERLDALDELKKDYNDD